ncbi:hypothetical protein JG687_00005010 [Phytophthora cactorum]|uniref:Uncharacterized protein n=1 Tax=Phytophthora cactorum TaxID=29920 RepID=A0A8T1UQ16_9STRA|nr:hypothetical protein JG687_00005010 [Phytophthora cactorum]
MVANREPCAFFFQPLGEALHRCKICGADRKQLPGTGYSNLFSHLVSRHEDFRAEYDTHHRGTERSLQDFGFVFEKTPHRYQWLRWVVERSMPLSEVDDERTRAMDKWRPTNSKAVKKDVITVAPNLGSVISEEMGDEIGVILYTVDGRLRRTLLVVSPLDDGNQDADAHIALFRNVLDVYNKTIDVIRFLVADNCNTNRSIATKLGVPLINSLMHQLRLPNNASELAKLTPLRAKARNVTRWSSTYGMLQRYVKIRAYIRQLGAVEDLTPRSGKHKKLVSLLSHLEKFESVCKHLQSEATSMSEICNGEKLSTAESVALRRLGRSRSDEGLGTAGRKRKERQESYAAQIIQQGRVKRRAGGSAVYSALATQIPPTSNACERLISESKVILTPQRSSILPAHFEMLAFLRANKDMWDITSLA